LNKIAILTDTDSSIPEELSEKLDIHQVPITVHFGEETFSTGIDINDQQLFARVDQEGKLPTTSAPSPGAFLEAYEQAFEAGADEIICFCVSGEVSATYGSAVSASQNLPERKIQVVDSRTLSMGQGFMVLAAAEAAREGATSAEILQIAHNTAKRTHFFAYLSTLKYLAMSGRVGHLAAGMAGLLNVKPILTIQNGKLDLLERVRTKKKASARIIELADNHLSGRSIERLSIVHVDALDKVPEFEAQLREALPCPQETILAELTSGLSVHSGAGMLGFAYVAAE
jgi:DegV family protein with EDD domain